MKKVLKLSGFERQLHFARLYLNDGHMPRTLSDEILKRLMTLSARQIKAAHARAKAAGYSDDEIAECQLLLAQCGALRERAVMV
jgi:hypothetical protein